MLTHDSPAMTPGLPPMERITTAQGDGVAFLTCGTRRLSRALERQEPGNLIDNLI